jgi:hypothetical protein
VPDPNPPGDDWQWDDVDWSEQAPGRRSEPAAGAPPAAQRSGLVPASRAEAAGPAAPAGDPAQIRRRRLVALGALGLVLVCAIVIPLVAFGGGGGNAVEPITAPATTVTTVPTTTQARPTTQTTTTAPTTTASTPLRVTLPGGETLKRGDSGAEVTQLQKALAALGFAVGTPDGKFGAATEAAVIDFQQSNDLTPDGLVGSDTVRLLNTALAASAGSG